MPPGTHSVLLSAQVISSVQEQQGHIAEGSMVRKERDRCRCFWKHYTTLSEGNHSCPFHTLNTVITLVPNFIRRLGLKYRTLTDSTRYR